jgi:hypothetical protein
MEERGKKTRYVIRISSQPPQIQIVIHEKQLEDVEYFNYLGNMTRNDARCTRVMKSKNCYAKSSIKQEDSLHQQIVLRIKEETSEIMLLEYSFLGS